MTRVSVYYRKVFRSLPAGPWAARFGVPLPVADTPTQRHEVDQNKSQTAGSGTPRSSQSNASPTDPKDGTRPASRIRSVKDQEVN